MILLKCPTIKLKIQIILKKCFNKNTLLQICQSFIFRHTIYVTVLTFFYHVYNSYIDTQNNLHSELHNLS